MESHLSNVIYFSSCLRLADVDGGEAAELPYALLLVFLRGNAPATVWLSHPPAFEVFGLVIYDDIYAGDAAWLERKGYCGERGRGVEVLLVVSVMVCVVVLLMEEMEGRGEWHRAVTRIGGGSKPWAALNLCAEPMCEAAENPSPVSLLYYYRLAG